MSAPQTTPREQIAYRGTYTQGDLRESLTLKADGFITVDTRTRRRPVSTPRVVAASVLALAGLVFLLLVTFDLAPAFVTGGGVFLASVSGLFAVGAGVYALTRLYFTRRRFEAHSSIDQGSLATLRGLKRERSDVTRFLLDVAFASVRLERAESVAATAQERARIAESSERLAQVATRAEEELVQARAMKRSALARLVEFTAAEEESERGREKF